MDERDYESSEEEYSDSNESYDENDEFYDDSEELEGGAYELNYVDGMYGNGRGGMLEGGGANKFTRYFKAAAKKGYDMKQAAVQYRKGIKVSQLPVKKRKSATKKRVTKKRSVSKGRLCKANGRHYKTMGNYKRFCIKPKSKPRRRSGSKTSRRSYTYDEDRALKCLTKGLSWCPSTKRCRKRENLANCFDNAGIPYFFKKGEAPHSFYDPETLEYVTSMKTMRENWGAYPDYRLYKNGRIQKKTRI